MGEMLVARVGTCGKFGWSTPSSLSGEDSCFVVMAKGQKGVFPTGPLSALIVVQLGKHPSVL